MPKLGRRTDYYPVAPFGTTDTPTFRPCIIGGHLINVLESPSSNSMDLPGDVISEKPNYVDPRALTDFTRKYNQPYQAPFYQRLEARRPPMFTKRPDSKDIWSRYPRLAPIDGNRIRNQQMSTVFEPEAWTRLYQSTGDSPFYKSPQLNTLRLENGQPATRELVNSRSSESQESEDKFRARLLSLLPRQDVLPQSPLRLSSADESRLLGVLSKQLQTVDPHKLRDVYLDIANRVDKQLTGFCQFQDLLQTLSRVSLWFPDDLVRVLAAMFISEDGHHRINYERFLSFVGAALKNREMNLPVGQENKNNSMKLIRKHSPIRHRPGSPFFGDGGQTKLLRMVEEQLAENNFQIDLDRLATSLQLEDKDTRGTLTADQIRDICFQHRIPIQESLIRGLLRRCQDGSRDEHYNWREFVRLIGDGQPVKARVPTSPRRQPRSPHTQAFNPSRLQPITGSRGQVWSTDQSPRPSWNRETPLSHQTVEVADASREIISRMDDQLRELQRRQEVKVRKSTRQQQLGSQTSSWFQNLLKFADSLYQLDQRFEGRLPLSDVAAWVKVNNKTYHLDIPETELSSALQQATRRGQVDIHKFLSTLKSL